MKIYTKTGDKGETGIIGKRLQKNSVTIELVGTLDELNAYIGLTTIKISKHKELIANLLKVQSNIFAIGGLIAGGKFNLDLKKETTSLEKEIDKLEKELEPLQNFILPGGSESSALLHLSRAVCRRTERKITEFLNSYENEIDHEPHKLRLTEVSGDLRSYINRLSDYFFVLARYANKLEKVDDIKWNS